MAEQIKIGDVVQLKSGGPKMTVGSTESIGGQIFWVWFVGNKQESGYFAPEVPTKADQSASVGVVGRR
jgi:uncharacterized protein YodC (DUF2158 family)